MCMCLGFAKLSYAQNLVVTASQTNATTNDIITFYATFYDQNSGCVDEGSVTWNFGTNAVIIDGAGSGMVQVRYTSAGTRRVAANVNVNCNGGRPSRLGSTVTVNITQAPITISGRVTNNCGEGVIGVTINLTGSGGFSNYSAVTEENGFYSITVPYGFTGTGTASKTNHTFSFSQQVSNTSTDVTLNFSVVAPAGFFISISECNGLQYSIGGLVPGFKYIITYENKNGFMNGSTEIEAHSSTMGFDLNRSCYDKICVQLKCGSQIPVCRIFNP